MLYMYSVAECNNATSIVSCADPSSPSPTAQALKAIATALGFDVGPCRLPLPRVSPAVGALAADSICRTLRAESVGLGLLGAGVAKL